MLSILPTNFLGIPEWHILKVIYCSIFPKTSYTSLLNKSEKLSDLLLENNKAVIIKFGSLTLTNAHNLNEV